MDVFSVLQVDADVSHSSALGSPEQQVAQLSFPPIFRLDNLSGQCLLGSITLKDDTVGKVSHLNQARAVGELGGSTTPQITGAHHAERHLLDKFSIESLFCPGREFLHFVLMYIAFASIGSGETDELALLALAFQDIAKHQVAHGHAVLRGIYQLSLIHRHDISFRLLPGIHLCRGHLIQGVLRYIRDVLVRSLYPCPIAGMFQNFHRSTHNGLGCHFGSMLTGGAERGDGKLHQSPRLFLGEFQYGDAIYTSYTCLLQFLKDIGLQFGLVHLTLDNPLTVGLLGFQFIDGYARIRSILLLDSCQQCLHFIGFSRNLVDDQIRFPFSQVASLPFHFTGLEVYGFATDVLLLWREFTANAFVACQAESIGTGLEKVTVTFAVGITSG